MHFDLACQGFCLFLSQQWGLGAETAVFLASLKWRFAAWRAPGWWHGLEILPILSWSPIGAVMHEHVLATSAWMADNLSQWEGYWKIVSWRIEAFRFSSLWFALELAFDWFFTLQICRVLRLRPVQALGLLEFSELWRFLWLSSRGHLGILLGFGLHHQMLN